MRSDRWHSCIDVFSAALEQPRETRAALLDRRCNGDTALREKVELLLKYHDSSSELIDTPAFAHAPELLLVDDLDALVGQQLGCYRMDAVLGAGGMGAVYLAYDERLGRKVALKLVPQSVFGKEGSFEQLQREARTTSALNHPNIMTIHEVGEIDSTHYIATEFIEGITLRERISQGRIPADEALNIAVQIARALSAAHRADIVHRDVKPENIMLRPDGFVKVLDFGIAKWAEQLIPGGEIIGTKRYMSPEQRRGQEVDARSDLWSFGVILSEMLTGTRTGALEHVVEKCLRENPAERYQTADELLSQLRRIEERSAAGPSGRWISIAAAVAILVSLGWFYGWRERQAGPNAAPAPIERGIAVLPFENLTAGENDTFFADGIQDDVLASLSRIKDLRVIARSSVADYRGARMPGKVREIGKALRVSHVLEATVRRSTDRAVVHAVLIDTRDEREVWSQRYERTLTDTLALQGELATDIAHALRATLTPSEAAFAATKPTQNPEAYLLYLRAREMAFAAYNLEKQEPAIRVYQQAIDLDPKFALARARLSMCATQLAPFYPQWKPRARAEADEAVRLRPDLGEAHLARSYYFTFVEGDYARAARELDRAAEMLPNSAEVPLTAAFIYKRQGRFRERIAALRQAEVLDPRNTLVLGYTINTLRWLRDWPHAIQTLDEYAAIAPEKARNYVFVWPRGLDEFRLTGDINVLKTAIAQQPDADAPATRDRVNFARYEIAMLERDYLNAARRLAAVPPELLGGRADSMSPHSKCFHEALLTVAANTEGKQPALELARTTTEARAWAPEPDGEEKPGEDLALLYAFLGRKEDAIRQAHQAIEHALGRPGTIEKNQAFASLAMVYAHTGEPEKAIDLIEHLLTVPADLRSGAVNNITLADLKWRWQWDPLRSHPRFQNILASPEPKTIY